MTNFPTTQIDQFNNPTSSTKTNAPGFDHAEQHANANDAIKALETKVGIDNSTDVDSIDYKIRRLLSRQLVVESIGTGDGVNKEFTLNFTPVGAVFVMDDNKRISAVVTEPSPGSFVVVCDEAPIGDVLIVVVKETV